MNSQAQTAAPHRAPPAVTIAVTRDGTYLLQGLGRRAAGRFLARMAVARRRLGRRAFLPERVVFVSLGP